MVNTEGVQMLLSDKAAFERQGLNMTPDVRMTCACRLKLLRQRPRSFAPAAFCSRNQARRDDGWSLNNVKN